MYSYIIIHHVYITACRGLWMPDRREIELRLRQKEAEIQHLEARLREARGYVRALRELLGLEAPSERSMVEQARDIILDRGHAVHITELLAAMGKDNTRETRVSLTSALSAYARRSDIFTREGPNRFGLFELKRRRRAAKPRSDPPDNFGELETSTEDKPTASGND
jgi:hypothetical protein